MSNQFSYELDERQIRIMLQDGESEYDSSAWNRFEQALQPEFKSQAGSFVPKLNLSISRSVIVPAIFIILIGGLSAMLFSFVDFKKKEEVKQEVALQPTAKPTPVKSTPKIVAPVKKEIVSAAIPEQKPIVASTPSVNTLPVAVVKKEEKTVAVKPDVKPVIAVPVKDNSLSLAADQRKETTAAPVMIKKKRKKIISEEIPTINTSSTDLNSGNATEPELELK